MHHAVVGVRGSCEEAEREDQEKKTFNENDIRNYTAAFLARQKSGEDGRLFTGLYF